MANARVLDKRRKSIRNIRKITRTMELIATARYRKAMDRANSATAYTRQITQIVNRLAAAGLDVKHPLLESRDEIKAVRVLVLTSNRGLCGGYNGNVLRTAAPLVRKLREQIDSVAIDVSGKRGVNGLKFRSIKIDNAFMDFEDQPAFAEVEKIADMYLAMYLGGELDRLDVVYTKFMSASHQTATVETLLPLASLGDDGDDGGGIGKQSGDPADYVKASGQKAMGQKAMGQNAMDQNAMDKRYTDSDQYEFLPSAESILAEVVPTSFKVRLFKCFLDAAVSEQVARMVAMKGATENAGDMIRQLSRAYNRARQSQITGEIMEIIGGVEALEG